MKKILLIFIGVVLMSSLTFASEGTMLFTNLNASQNISSLSIRVIPGSSNFTAFRIFAQGSNITNIALFSFSQKFNITITPANESYVAAGDYRVFFVNVSVSNLTQAGIHTEPLIILSSRPEQRLLPILIEIPETTGWTVSPNNVTLNVTADSFGVINISLQNSGNVPISGHVSLLDLHNLLWFDQSDFLIPQGGSISRPLYYSIKNLTPATYEINLSFIDTLNNVRTFKVFFLLPDTTPPTADITFSRAEVYPGQKVSALIDAQDDVKVDAVRGRIGTGSIFNISKAESGKYVYELTNLSIGENRLLFLINDTSGNLLTINKTLEVNQFEYLTIEPEVIFYRFKLGSQRQVKILSSITSTQISVMLKSLSLSNSFNNSINISINGEPLLLNEEKNLTASGEVYMAVEGSKNFTKFSGMLEIKTLPEVNNPQPEIAFEGEISSYDVSPPMSFTMYGILKSCSPDDVGVYENSSFICTEKHPIDVKPEELTITTSKASYDSLISGYDSKYSYCEQQKNGAIGWNWFLLFIILAFIGGVAFLYLVIEKTDFDI